MHLLVFYKDIYKDARSSHQDAQLKFIAEQVISTIQHPDPVKLQIDGATTQV
jgi:hypothetical protein